MKTARLVVLAVALAAGGVAAFLVGGSEPQPPAAAPPPAAPIDTAEILVARGEFGMGHALTAQDTQWQVWPASAVSPAFIRRSDRPAAIEQLAGAIARTRFVAGEPILEAKLVKADGSGFMAALLPSGMRAVSTDIAPETGAGGFILPNDRVDVILTRRDREADKTPSGDTHVSETVLTNVRVLAIDQGIEEKNGQHVMVGKTATLEVTPRQAETLALSRQLGTLSLSLRSMFDSGGAELDDTGKDDKGKQRLNLVRFGVVTSSLPK